MPTRRKSSPTPKRPALLVQWARAPIPADVSHPSDARRERLVGVVEDAMRRPLPMRVSWSLRVRRFALGAAVACLTLLAVGSGLARTGVRTVVARISGLVRSAPEVVRVPASAPPTAAPEPAPPATAAPPATPSASCPSAAVSAPAPVAIPSAPRASLPAAKRSSEPPAAPVVATTSQPPSVEAPAPALVETELAAQNRLYAHAMTARRGGMTTEALRALDEFIRLYPRAPLAQDARVEHFRTLAEQRDREAAARAAREYLTLYPDGFARDEARALASSSP
jgi:hypothetical protein